MNEPERFIMMWCPEDRIAVSKQVDDDKTCPQCGAKLTSVPPYTVPLPKN